MPNYISFIIINLHQWKQEVFPDLGKD